MTRTRWTFWLVVLLAWPGMATAQPTAVTPHPEARQRDRARTYLVVRIADALSLNDEDALKVSAVIRASDQHRQQLVQQRQALEGKLRAALAKSPPDTAELSALITAGNDLDQQLAMVPEETFRGLQKILTVEQQAKLILFRREVQGEVRRALQRRASGGRKAEKSRGAAVTDD